MFTVMMVVVLTLAMAVLFIYSAKKEKKTYDERQVRARGKACQLAFSTLIIYIFAIVLLVEEYTLLKNYIGTLLMVGIASSICLFASYCIWTDAYLALKDEMTLDTAAFIFACLGGLSVFLFIKALRNGTPIEELLLLENCNVFILGVSYLVMFINIVLKTTLSQKEAESSEES